MAQTGKTNEIKFKLMFEAGDTKNAFGGLKKELQELRALSSQAFGGDPAELQKLVGTAKQVETAMTKAYNPKLNTVNVQKFNNELKKTGLNIQTVYQNFAIAGTQGQSAFIKMTSQLMQMNATVRQTNKFLDGIGTTLFNTVKQTITSSIIQNISGTVQKAYYYVKDLDRSLNDIRIVTGKSAEEMGEFAKQANNAAKALAVTTEDYTKGSLIYYQQGLDDETVKALTDITAKTSNVTGQSMSAVSEELTAVQNGYQVANQAAEEGMGIYERYVDKMAAVGATTASNLEELATAMSKVASAASTMGVDFDDLNAQIATIVSVTRQAPESVGTALKTIYARLGDLKVDGVDEFGTKLGDVSKQLKTMGIDIVDQNDNMRDMSDVIAEVAQKQQTWTGAQKEAAAIAMAGKRQYNNLVALFDNQDMYGEALETSMNAAGTLEKQQETAMESLANKMDVLKATAEDLYDSLFDTNTISGFVTAGTKVLAFFTKMADSIGGLNNILPLVVSSLTQLFSKQIANGIGTIASNFINVSESIKVADQNAEQLRVLFKDSAFQSAEGNTGRPGQVFTEGFTAMKSYYTTMQQYQSIMTQEEKEQYRLILEEHEANLNNQVTRAQQIESLDQIYNRLHLISKETLNNVENVENQRRDLDQVEVISTELQRALSVINKTEKASNYRLTNPFNNNIVSLKEYIDLLKQAFNLTDQQAQALEKAIGTNSGNALKENLKGIIEELKQVGVSAQSINELTSKIDGATSATQSLGENLENTLSFRNNIQTIVSATSAVGQLTFALSSLSNIIKTFEDGDFTSENITQGLLSASFVIPSLISGFTNLAAALYTYKNATVLKAAAEEKDAAAMNAAAAVKKKDDLINIKRDQNIIAATNAIKANEKELEAWSASQEKANKLKEEEIAIAQIAIEKKKIENAEKERDIALEKQRQALKEKDDADVLRKEAQAASRDQSKTPEEKKKARKDQETYRGLEDSYLKDAESQGARAEALNASIEQSNIKIKENEAKARTLNAEAAQLEAQSVDAVSAADQFHAQSATADAAATKAEAQMAGAEAAAAQAETVAKQQETRAEYLNLMASKGNTVEKIKQSQAILKNKEVTDLDTISIAKNTIAKTAAVVIAAALVAAIIIAIKHVEKQREALLEEAKAQLESVKATQEKIKANQDAVASFEKAYREYKKTKEVTDQLTSATEQLIETYRIEDGYLLQRNKAYDELNAKLEETKRKELDLAKSETQKGIEAATDEMLLEGSKGWFNAGSMVEDTYTGMFRTEDLTNSRRFGDTLKELAKNYSSLDYQELGVNRFVSFDKNDTEAAKEYYNYLLDVQKVLEKNNDKDSKVYEQVTEQLKAMGPAFEEIKSQEEALLKTDFAIEFEETIGKLEDSSSLSAINNEIEKLHTLFSGKVSSNEFENLIQKTLIDSGKFSDEIINQVLVAQSFLNKHDLLLNTDINEDEVFEQISKLNEKQLAFLTVHLNSAVLSEDLEKQINDHSEYLTYIESQQASEDLKDFIGKYDSKKGFEKGAVTSLYGSDIVEEKVGLSEEQFNALDIDQQLQTATRGQIDFAKESNEAGKVLKDNLTPQVEAAKKALDEQNDRAVFNSSEVIHDLIKGDAELSSKQEDLENAFIELSNKGYDNLSESTQGLIQKFHVLTGVEVEQLSVQGENLKYSKKLEEDYYDLQSQLDELVEKEVDFKEVLEKVSEVTKATDAIIDSIQASYKSLIEIVDSYNETGKQTIDNVQTLMEMSDQYVAQLEFEGDTLSLNEEGFKAVTLAKLDDLVATENLAYEQKVLELAQIAEGNSTDAAAQKTSLFTQMLQTLGLVSREAATDVMNLSAAMDLIGKKGSEETKAALEQATQAHENRLKALEGLRNQINSASGSGGLRDMMGASKKDKKSGSKDKDKDKKEQEDEFDRYQEIKKAIDAVDRALKTLEKDKENLYGYQLIDALKQENQLLEQQAANYNTLYEMQQQEAAELRDQLSTMGLMFDASGAITNYAAATSAALQQYAAAIEQYNAGLMDETTLKVYEKSYENFKKLLERYDKLYYTEMQDTQEKLDELRRKELANNLKAWEIEIQIHLDEEKMRRDWNDFLKDIKQDFRKVFSDLTIDVKYDEKNFKSFINDVGTTIGAINDVEAEIDKMMNGGSSTMFESVSQAQEKLKELQEQLLDQGKSLYELYKQVQNSYLDGIDQVKDQFDELMKRYQKFNDELEFHKELIELLYGDKAYDLMDQYYSAQTKNIEAQINSMRQQVDFWQNEFNKSFDFAISLGSDVDINDFTTQTEDMKRAYENMVEAQGNLNDLVLEGVKILKEQYLNSINKIIDTMNQGLWGTSMEKMKKDWEFQKDVSDLFLDNTQKAYKLQNFSNKISEDISKSSSLKAQQKLQAFRERELDYLENKNNLTKEDIELAEMRYQIALKEIALEDAQNNKTSMKLTRNEQGNQSYQYVADEDDVAAKQQDLMSSLGEYYEKALQYTRDGGDAIIEQTEKMQEELAEAWLMSEGDMEAYKQREQEIYEKYKPIIEALIDNTAVYEREALMITSEIFGRICEDDATAYEKLTDEQKRMVDEQREVADGDFSDLRSKIIEGFYPDLEDAAKTVFENTAAISHAIVVQMAREQATDKTSFRQTILTAIDDLVKATQNYASELDKLQQIAGMDFSQIGAAIDNVSSRIDAMEGTTEKMVDNSSKYLDELRRVLQGIADEQNNVIAQILAAQNAMQAYLAAAAAARQVGTPTYANGGGGGSIPDANGGGDGSSGSGEEVKDYQSIHTSDGQTIYANSSAQKDQIIEELKKKQLQYSIGGPYSAEEFMHMTSQLGGAKQDPRQQGPVLVEGYATGGYTGEQGDSGRIAMLHQKELVLNADDTENFLSGISMIRDMTSLNGSISNAITDAVANMMLTLGRTSVGTNFDNSTVETATNNVFNITAEFPNANDVDEIRQAILSLPNLASQYIGKNIR